MRTTDHLALGVFLVKEANDAALSRHSRAFLIGSVEPDYNIASYVRDTVKRREISRHGADQAFPYAAKCMAAFEKHGLSGFGGYFMLGTMLHFVADAFTYPHNAFWSDSMAAHITYERALHGAFLNELKARSSKGLAAAPQYPLEYFSKAHDEYSKEGGSIQTDCRYIIDNCAAMLLASLRYAVPAAAMQEEAKEIFVYEGAYNNGLVQTGR